MLERFVKDEWRDGNGRYKLNIERTIRLTQ